MDHHVSPCITRYHQVSPGSPGHVLRCGHLRPTWKANEKTQAERQHWVEVMNALAIAAIAGHAVRFAQFAEFARVDWETGFQDSAVD